MLFVDTSSAQPQGVDIDHYVAVGSSVATIYPGGTTGDGVLLMWSHRLPSGEVLRLDESLAASFAPVAAGGVGKGRLAVAGKSRRTGHSLLQVWQLREPAVVLTHPSGKPTLQLRGIERLHTYQDENVPTRRRVDWIATFSDESRRFLVQFDGGYIWEYSHDNFPPRLARSTAGQRGVVALPITSWHCPLYAEDHVDVGKYLLLLSKSSKQPMLLLLDSDRDGRLDKGLAIDKAARPAMELDNPAKFVR